MSRFEQFDEALRELQSRQSDLSQEIQKLNRWKRDAIIAGTILGGFLGIGGLVGIPNAAEDAVVGVIKNNEDQVVTTALDNALSRYFEKNYGEDLLLSLEEDVGKARLSAAQLRALRENAYEALSKDVLESLPRRVDSMDKGIATLQLDLEKTDGRSKTNFSSLQSTQQGLADAMGLISSAQNRIGEVEALVRDNRRAFDEKVESLVDLSGYSFARFDAKRMEDPRRMDKPDEVRGEEVVFVVRDSAGSPVQSPLCALAGMHVPGSGYCRVDKGPQGRWELVMKAAASQACQAVCLVRATD